MPSGTEAEQIAVCDIGGTHARFALAAVGAGRVLSLDPALTLKTVEHSSFELALAEFAARKQINLPRGLAIAFAGPVGTKVLQLTNNPWLIRPEMLRERLSLDQLTIINDLGAVGHAVAELSPEHFRTVCGPEAHLPARGMISIVGPGTGLGAAALLKLGTRYEVIETEGGHMDFAPLDPFEDQLLAELRRVLGRVSIERIASGQGLWNLYEAMARLEGKGRRFSDQESLWTAALAGTDPLACAALHRLVLSLGAIAGDLALAQGAAAVVIAGGLGRRLADHLRPLGFADRFVAKGRFERRMNAMSVKLVTFPDPGLLGAAAAFARKRAFGERPPQKE